MNQSSDMFATAVTAALLYRVPPAVTGLPSDAWERSGLMRLGINLDFLAAALRDAPGPVTALVQDAHLVAGIGVGSPEASAGSPFTVVRLLSAAEPPASAPVSVRAARPSLAPPPTLDHLVGAVLSAIGESALAAPGAPHMPLVDAVRVRVALVAVAARSSTRQDSTSARAVTWVTGDLSGIQAYLYSSAHVGEGGVARRLRARSLTLQLLTEDVAERLRRAGGVVRANAIMRSGGKFHLLLPPGAATLTAIAEEQHRLDQWLLERTNGEVALLLAARALPLDRLRPGSLSDALTEAEAALAEAKARRFASVLQSAARWQEMTFVRPALTDSGTVCPSCRKLTVPAGLEVCVRCGDEATAGARLPRASDVWLLPPGPGRESVVQLPGSVAGLGNRPPDDALLTIPLRVPGAPGEAGGLGAYVPTDTGGAPLTFGEMATAGRGRPLLGFLKMDVDRLGEIFTHGLRRDGESRFDALPYVAALSRVLDSFFTVGLRRLLESRFSTCYQVYAGGDDVLIVGPWWETLRLATAIRQAFRQVTGDNPEVTISAGLVLAQQRTPVAVAARQADEALDWAKHGIVLPPAALMEARRRRLLNHEQGSPGLVSARGPAGSGAVDAYAPPAACVPVGGRDCVSVLGDLLGWACLEMVLDDAERLADLRPPRALLHRLIAFSEMWLEYRDGDPAGLRLFPLLAYSVRRTIDERSQPDLARWATRLTSASYQGDGTAPLEHVGLMARLTMLLMDQRRT